MFILFKHFSITWQSGSNKKKKKKKLYKIISKMITCIQLTFVSSVTKNGHV